MRAHYLPGTLILVAFGRNLFADNELLIIDRRGYRLFLTYILELM